MIPALALMFYSFVLSNIFHTFNNIFIRIKVIGYILSIIGNDSVISRYPFTPIKFNNTGNNFGKSCFSGTVWTYKSNLLPTTYLEVNIIENGFQTIRFTNSLKFNIYFPT